MDRGGRGGGVGELDVYDSLDKRSGLGFHLVCGYPRIFDK